MSVVQVSRSAPERAPIDWAADRAVEVREIIGRYPEPRSAIMPLLHLAQEVRGYVADEDLHTVAELLDLTPAYVDSVCSFYSMFKRHPVGRYVITVCANLSCGLNGADSLVAHLERRLGIRAGETTADGLITLEVTGECLAACDGAPVCQVNEEYVERLTPERADELIESLRGGAPGYPPRAVTAPPAPRGRGGGARADRVAGTRGEGRIDPIDGRPAPDVGSPDHRAVAAAEGGSAAAGTGGGPAALAGGSGDV